eukprot:COSAG05_NODE_285_length_12188_cov_539.399537_1_plen_65_part_00
MVRWRWQRIRMSSLSATVIMNIRVLVQIIRHSRTHLLCKYQSCMFENVGLNVHASVSNEFGQFA